MPMLINLFLFAIIMLSGSEMFSQGFWKEISSPTTKVLKKLFFVDSLNGWAAGAGGTIIHTSDAGKNWEIQNEASEKFSFLFLI